MDLGRRLRNEVPQEFIPYIGVHWAPNFDRAADDAELERADVCDLHIVSGMRLWF